MVVLPSSPVWYQTRGADTSHSGVLAFGSRNLVYTLDLKNERPTIYGILSGHTDKVTSCSFCPPIIQDQLLRLVSGADDCVVKVWDVKQKLVLHEHSGHGAHKIIAVHWSPVNSSLILSGDEKGFVIAWNLDNNKTNRFDPDGTSQLNLCCLTCSPHDENIVAVGYKSGAVSLMDIKKNGNVIRKLRAHTNEIHGIAWMPDRNESLLQRGDERLDKPIDGFNGIIVTGSKDKTIKLWSISRGKCLRSLKIPSRVTKGRRVNEDVARLFTAVYWPSGSPTRFISSGYNGDIIIWDVQPDANNLFEILAAQSHDTGHQRIVFNICSGADPKSSILTTSMDRQIFHWTIPEMICARCSRPDWVLPTLGGFVYSLAVSTQDPSTLALGVGDGMIRIWKTKSPKSSYDITILWQGIKEKVMSLCWHPYKEGCLAFATEDGKVGVYDILSMRPPTLSTTYHLKPVYSLSWGPVCAAKSEDSNRRVDIKSFNVYSCGGDGVIYQHDFKSMDSDAINIDQIIEMSNPGSGLVLGKRSEVSWSNDHLLLGIGNDNGSIEIFSAPCLEHIVTIKCHSKIVNCVRWKPGDSTAGQGYEVATGSNHSNIYVHDLAKAFADRNYRVGDKLDYPIVISKPTKSLMGHLARITGISYNARNPKELVSCSYDGTAQVWNTESESPLFNFRGHHGRLMCVSWTSVITGDGNKSSGIIYTGADDYTVHGWYAEDQQHTEPVKVLPDFGFGPKNKFQAKKKAKKKKGSQSAQSTSQSAESSTPINSPISRNCNGADHDLEMLLWAKKAELIANLNTSQSISSPTLPSPESSRPSSKDVRNETVTTNHDEETERKLKKRSKNMFPQSVSLDNRRKSEQHQDCLKIVQWKIARDLRKDTELQFLPGDMEHLNLGFYTDRRAAFRMMKNESDKLREDSYHDTSTNIKLWMGDVVGAINDAASSNQLTDQLVAMAPMAGQSFWRGTCHKFARQLIEDGHPLHAVHYLLACDRPEEAVETLISGRHYREAVALARARFSDSDPLVVKTVKAWAHKLKIGGSVELAAKCFASIGEFEEAANVLSQRATSGASTVPDSDIASLWAAASIAKCAKKLDFASAYANRAVYTVCCRTWDWEKNQQILASYPNLKEYRFISLVHEKIVSIMLEKSLTKEIPSMRNSSPATAEAVSHNMSSFVECILNRWHSDLGAPGETMLDSELCLDLLKEVADRTDDYTDNKFFLQLSMDVAAAICTHCINVHNTEICENAEDNLDWLKYIAHALGQISKSGGDTQLREELTTLLCAVVSWCLKTGESSKDPTNLLLRQDEIQDGKSSIHMQTAIKYMLDRVDIDIYNIVPYLNSKLHDVDQLFPLK